MPSKLSKALYILLLIISGILIGGVINAYYPDKMYGSVRDNSYWAITAFQAFAIIAYVSHALFSKREDIPQDPHPEHIMD